MTLIIPEDIEARIFAPIGYPVVTEEDLEVPFSFLRKTAIWPAMKEYFKYFPLENHQFYAVGTNFELPFPSDTTFGVTDARVHANSGFQGSTSSMNPFVLDRFESQSTFGHFRNQYGTGNDYGMTNITSLVQAASKARQNNNKRFRVRVDESQKKITGFTNMSGQIEVTWAEYSHNWSDIKMVYEEDVIDLAAANILIYFGMLRGQESSDVPVQFDASEFTDTGRQMKEEIIGRWRQATKVTMVRK